MESIKQTAEAFQIRVLAVAALVAAACGGQTPDAAPAEQEPTEEDNPACRNVVFAPSDSTATRDTPTGIVACPASNDDPVADFYVSHPMQCAGMGAGKGQQPLRSAVCASDADCPQGTTCGALGACYEPPACDDDSQCGTGSACVCASQYSVFEASFLSAVPYNQCAPAQCRADDDCNGYSCALSVEACTGRVVGLYCHSERDECTQHSDCGDPERVCAYDSSASSWRCDDRRRMCGI